MINNKWAVSVICAFSLGAFAADYTWTGAGAESDSSYASPLENPGNYSNGDGYPATDDVIVIPADTDLAITNRVDLDWLKRLSRVKPEAETSRLIITVPEGEIWTNACPMSAVNVSAAGSSDFVKGELVKRGDGALVLDAGKKLSPNGSTVYEFWTGLTAEEGDLMLPQDAESGNRYYGYVTVDKGARFFTVRSGDSSETAFTTFVRGIFGDGVITNTHPSVVNQLQTMPSATQRASMFSGEIGGAYDMTYTHYNNGGDVYLLGTNNTYGAVTTIMGGRVFAQSFGTEGNPSSLGTYSRIHFGANSASRLVYLGKGETTDKKFVVYQNASGPAYIDAGAHGGLKLTYSVEVGTEQDKTRTIVFTGSNTTECVLDCYLYGRYWNAQHTAFYDQPYYAKEGSGTWRVTHHVGRRVPCGWAIREGTLRYDSLDEKGVICSLGTATNLTSGTANDMVDYAFCLGSTDASAAPAVFSYSGTNEYSVSTRPAVLVADATFRNESDCSIRFAGVRALTAGLKTLTLDGDTAATNELADISDGGGQIGVTKDGDGTWVLGGSQTFTGPVDVKKGTLIVRKIADPKYTWFRWTITEMHAKTNSSGTVVSVDYPHVNSFALLDSSGAWQNANMEFTENAVATLKPGFSTWQNVWGVVCTPQSDTTPTDVPRIFINTTNYGAWIHPMFGNSYVRPEPDLPYSWPRLVMRLKGGANEVVAHDIMNVWGAGNNPQRCVKGDTIEGSVDGLHWEEVARTNNMPVAGASWTWSYRNTTATSGSHTGGAPFARGSSTNTWHVLEGGNTVSVAPGAKLVADGDITLSSIKLAATGGGTREGFSFAESGTIDVTGWNGSHGEIPLNFSNAANLSNVSGWNLKIGGAASSRRFAVSTTGVRLLERGLRLSFR